MTTTTKLDPVAEGRADCDDMIADGCDPADLVAAPGWLGADEALINAIGTDWIFDAAGAPDHSDASWAEYGLPWCRQYAAAYAARAAELLAACPEHGTAGLTDLGAHGVGCGPCADREMDEMDERRGR